MPIMVLCVSSRKHRVVMLLSMAQSSICVTTCCHPQYQDGPGLGLQHLMSEGSWFKMNPSKVEVLQVERGEHLKEFSGCLLGSKVGTHGW